MVVVFLPSYWRYEPRDSAEGFDVSLTTLALVALADRTSPSCAARRRGRAASDGAGLDADGPAARPSRGPPCRRFEIDTDVPIMALVGVLRPRLLITRRVVGALTGEELAASVAHELGHWRALDNLKRLAMRAAPDLLSDARPLRAISSGAGRRRPSTLADSRRAKGDVADRGRAAARWRRRSSRSRG